MGLELVFWKRAFDKEAIQIEVVFFNLEVEDVNIYIQRSSEEISNFLDILMVEDPFKCVKYISHKLQHATKGLVHPI